MVEQQALQLFKKKKKKSQDLNPVNYHDSNVSDVFYEGFELCHQITHLFTFK